MFQFIVVVVRTGACALAVWLFSVAAVAGEAPKVNTGPDRIAIKGYDTVAY